MGLQHYTQDMSRIPLKYHINVLFYTKYTHPTLICRGTDGRTENIDRNCDVLPIEYAITIAFSMLIGKVAGYCQL